MDTSQTPVPDGQPQGDRAQAERLYWFAQYAYGGVDFEDADLAELANRSADERRADAQLMMLQAIYHELRHGHDQVAAQTAALAEHSAALSDHADTLGQRESQDDGPRRRAQPLSPPFPVMVAPAGATDRRGEGFPPFT